MKVQAIIQARLGSSRPPGKCVADLGGEPMLARVVLRAKQARLLQDVIVATTTDPQDEPIVALCVARGWKVFRGSGADVLDRFYQAAVASELDTIVRLTADCPVVSATLIDRAVKIFLESSPPVDYVSNCYPRRSFPRGLDVEAFSRTALLKAWKEDRNPSLREHVTPYFYLNPDKFRLVGFGHQEDLSDLRLTVDTAEDLAVIRPLYEHFGRDDFSWEEAIDYLRTTGQYRTNHHVVQKPLMTQLALGTAQLGMNYGVANVTGKPAGAVARQLVKQCWQLGVRWFDTAQAYGDSEAILGKALDSLETSEAPRVVTKLHPHTAVTDGAAVRRAVELSRARLGLNTIWALLLHREEWLDHWDGALRETLLGLVAEGVIERIGVSVCSVERACQSLAIPELTVLQVPANVFDRRICRAGVPDQLEIRGGELLVRSVYLQGLALMDADQVPMDVERGREAVATYEAFCRKHHLDRRQFAIDYIRHLYPTAMIILGAETASQAEANCELFGGSNPDAELCEAWTRAWPEDHERLVNPACWGLRREP